MTSYLPYDLQSVLPGHKGKPAKVPEIGEQAPPIDGVNYTANPHLIAFVRHCGCPFAEKEVKDLAAVQKADPNVYIVIVAHSEKDVVDDWFERRGKSNFKSLDRVRVIADPKYEIYDRFGIGQLPFTALFSWQVISDVRNLAAQGIKNTRTGQGSNRWQNSGGFAVDIGGKVQWKKVATHAGDTCDYQQAVKSVL
jgi:hypothetical protein